MLKKRVSWQNFHEMLTIPDIVNQIQPNLINEYIKLLHQGDRVKLRLLANQIMRSLKSDIYHFVAPDDRLVVTGKVNNSELNEYLTSSLQGNLALSRDGTAVNILIWR